MFQFPGCALHALWIQAWILPHYGQWVPPFGHLRINACLQLPEAFRRLPRPSSAPSAKASTVRPFQLNLLRSGFFLCFIGYLVFKERDCFLNLLLCSLVPRNPSSLNLLEDEGAK
ncbi:hypothetical protein GTCCBUS3UF5_100 [Geobacillus thermoleovorans CCB_US3_UF5]|uniref:Uncharacterized protein n=1 Tax=Geobacillus thermoleovorans CCB_US3_UF5 TaxID=1111068 RepID=A0ABM5MCF1_GEOTH|nr:hypothetical protein GTCCBUS3UF5_100 [Geobacillus thermoleovorans CCB_US3_UF5]